MIDTVILKIPSHQWGLPDPHLPDLGRWSLQGRNSGFERRVNNPTAKDKASGDYFPRLTAIKQGVRIQGKFLKIEFSAPKLLFGNNVDELTGGDFQAVIARLQDRLKRMGVYVLTKFLEEAEVTGFHPSKNFLLSDGFTASYIIRDLGRVGLPRRLDMSKVTFTNDGKSLQLYSAAHSVVFYDKVADLSKTRGRAIDKNQTARQTSLFDAPGSSTRPPEILRMEVRLSKKQKMNAMLTRLGYKKDPTFREVFDANLCRSILRNYWQEYASNGYAFILDQAGTPQTILKSLLVQGMKPKEAIYLFGLHTLCRDVSGVIGLRTILGEHSSQRQWPRVSKDMARLNALHQVTRASPRDWRRQVERGIDTMAPYRLSNELKRKRPPDESQE